MPVRKRISRITLPSAQHQERGCVAELTEAYKHGEAWWTLGIEATGPSSLLRRELEATATLVLAEVLPDGMELGTDHLQSYARWLARQSDAETAPDPQPLSGGDR